MKRKYQTVWGMLAAEHGRPVKSSTAGLDKMTGTIPAAAHVLQLRSLAGLVDTKLRMFELVDLRRVCGVRRKVAALRLELVTKLQEVVKHEEELANEQGRVSGKTERRRA